MTQMNTGPSRARPPAENDIYTVLLVIAFLCMLIATVFVGYQAQSLFGSLLPFPGG